MYAPGGKDLPGLQRGLLAGVGAGEIDQATLRYKRFRDFLFMMNRADDPKAVGDFYMNALSQEVLLPGALEAVREIAARVKVGAVTNGIAFIQHGRLDASPIRPYLSALVISRGDRGGQTQSPNSPPGPQGTGRRVA